jgi:hypothetical protein
MANRKGLNSGVKKFGAERDGACIMTMGTFKNELPAAGGNPHAFQIVTLTLEWSHHFITIGNYLFNGRRSLSALNGPSGADEARAFIRPMTGIGPRSRPQIDRTFPVLYPSGQRIANNSHLQLGGG